MSRAFHIFCVTGALLVSTHRLPAPIAEESTPTPVPAGSTETKSKRAKSQGSEALSDSSLARRFDGTWKGTLVEKIDGAVYTTVSTLTIRDGKTADLNIEGTFTLLSGRWWGFLSKAYRHLSPLHLKATNHADHLVESGSDLMIPWSGGQLVDWVPKTLPLEEAQKLAKSQTSNKPAAFTLKGDELAANKIVYHRVK